MSAEARVLFVDDDSNVLAAIQRQLRKRFDVVTALGPKKGLAVLELMGPFAVCVTDMTMPEMNGVDFLREARRKSPRTVPIMLTGNGDQKTAAEAVNDGRVFRFLSKPCDSALLETTIEEGIQYFRSTEAERGTLERTLTGSVRVLSEILALSDPEAFGRAQSFVGVAMAMAAKTEGVDLWAVETAARLSRLGNVTVPPTVLARARQRLPLTGPEKDMLGRVPEVGARLLENIPRLEDVALIVRYQNKRFDGGGFPVDEVAGKEIPFGARLLRVASDLAELQEAGAPTEAALDRMVRVPGVYDPDLLAAARALFLREEAAPPGTDSEEMHRIEDLSIGQFLAADVLRSDGILLIRAGHEVTATLLERLRNFAKVDGVRMPIRLARRPS